MEYLSEFEYWGYDIQYTKKLKFTTKNIQIDNCEVSQYSGRNNQQR